MKVVALLPRWVRFVAALALVVASSEALLRHFDLFDPTELPDPYMGFAGTTPLYRCEVGDDGQLVRRTSPNKGEQYRRVEFPCEKAANELRIFVAGGSSIYAGRMQDPDASIPGLLELYLAPQMPERRLRVINSGGAGTGSLQNLEVVREVTGYGADVLVLYPEGGEKNLIPPMPGGVLACRDEESPLRVECRKLFAPMRSYVAVREICNDLRPSEPDAPFRSAFGAMVGYALSRPFTEDTFCRVFEFKQDRVPVLMPHVIPACEVERANARFVRCLRESIAECRANGVTPVLVLPLHNLESSFYLRFHIDPTELLPGTEERWKQRYERGLAQKRAGKYREALATLQSVRELYVEDRDDILAFNIAECWRALGHNDKHRTELLGIYERREMIRAIRAVALEEDVLLVEPLPFLVDKVGGKIPGHAWFEDSYHPLPRTNGLVALHLARELVANRVVPSQRTKPAVLAAAQRVVEERVSATPLNTANEIHAAMLAGDVERAATIARTLPKERLSGDFVLTFHAGWALTRAGDLDAARKLHATSVMKWGGRRALGLPDLSNDAALVEHAFQGDVFAIF